MDKEISKSDQRRSLRKKWFVYLLVLLGAVFAIWSLKQLVTKTANQNEFRVATVETGIMRNMVSASGTVLPAFERVINSPVTTEIKLVVLPKGTFVQKGELIIELDQEFSQLEFDKQQDQLSLKRNNIDKLKLQYDKDLLDLDYQNQIKKLEISSLKAQVRDQNRLLKIGGATEEELESAKMNLQVAELEQKMLENNLNYAKSVNLTEKNNLELEFKIQEKEFLHLKRKLRETSVRSTLDGSITWINENIGKTVQEGEPLVKIAVLDRYIVEATTSDRNTEKIQIGQPVEVRINNTTLTGRVQSVLPEVKNNSISFLVELDQADADVLRPNIRAEVFLITSQKENVLRVKNGMAFRGASEQNVFLVNDGKAIKTKISRGLTNSDFVEITSNNIKVGDKIIISDTKDYDHLDQFIIQ